MANQNTNLQAILAQDEAERQLRGDELAALRAYEKEEIKNDQKHAINQLLKKVNIYPKKKSPQKKGGKYYSRRWKRRKKKRTRRRRKKKRTRRRRKKKRTRRRRGRGGKTRY